MNPEQPIPMPVAKQILYPNVQISVNPSPDGNIHLVIVAPGEVLVFPMGVEYAQNLGKQLSAPRIVTAPAGVVPINGNGRGH